MQRVDMNTLRFHGADRATDLPRATDLAAARVPVSAHPWEAPRMTATADSIQLYGRVADRIEVATRLAAGRLLDVRA